MRNNRIPIALRRCLQGTISRVPLARDLLEGRRLYRELQAKVSSAHHNELTMHCDGLPIPPIKLRDMVHKGAVMAEDFLLEGRRAFRAVKGFLEQNGVTIEPGAEVYEFGVGCGRIARHFLQEGLVNFTGSDVDRELVDWCTANLSESGKARRAAVFFRNEYRPPVSRPAEVFDLIFAVSVVTHMQAEVQAAWMHELHRLLKPQGRLVVSILERSRKELPAGVLVVERIDAEFKRSWLGQGSAPSVYFATFNTVDYMREAFASVLELVSHSSRAIRDTQTLLLYKKC